MSSRQELDRVIQNICKVGPTRILLDTHEGVHPRRAKEMGYARPTVIFIRNDYWSLGAYETNRREAQEMWAGDWIAKLVWDGYRWLRHPVENGGTDVEEG
jgi:hypothetical protein